MLCHAFNEGTKIKLAIMEEMRVNSNIKDLCLNQIFMDPISVKLINLTNELAVISNSNFY